MASKVCEEELNSQLQAMNARLDSIERTISTQWELQILHLVKNIVALATISGAAAAILSADPQLALLILGADKIEELMDALPGGDFREVMLKIASDSIGTQLAGQLMSDVESRLQSALSEAQQALDDAIENEDPQEIIDALTEARDNAQDAVDSVTGFFSSINNASICSTASGIFGL